IGKKKSEGSSCCQIVRKCRCSPSTVGYTLQKYRQTHSLEEKPRSERPRVSSELQQQWSNQTGVQYHCLRSYKAVKKPLINDRQSLAQRCWAQAHKN
uniref:Transposase Tc1-like domain-containing protein n=1 Tax=Amphiprion percula TaxID=161767 RepID=A0A3P8S083_AMPPE